MGRNHRLHSTGATTFVIREADLTPRDELPLHSGTEPGGHGGRVGQDLPEVVDIDGKGDLAMEHGGLLEVSRVLMSNSIVAQLSRGS
jgi:hypothetical protein